MNDNFLEYAVRCSLIDYLDRPVLVSLRDGKALLGKLM
jgi:small nuclear ribonucleoprotein (snRNP)-like protein